MRQFVVEASLYTGARRVCGGVALCSMTPMVLHFLAHAFRGEDDHFIHYAHMLRTLCTNQPLCVQIVEQ